MINLESMVKFGLSHVDTLKEELYKNQGMLKDIFANDEIYKTHDETVKEATRIRTATKNQILKQPQAADLDGHIRALRAEIKDGQLSLFDYAREYHRMTGVNEIEADDGTVYEIVTQAKLVKKTEIYK